MMEVYLTKQTILTCPELSTTTPLTFRCVSLVKYEYGIYFKWHVTPLALF